MSAISTSFATVEDLMTADPVLASVDLPVTDAAELLAFYQISGLPVLDWIGYLAGVISQTDILRAQADEQVSSPWTLAVRDVMTRPALTVRPGTTLEEAARLMTEQHVHRLVVVDGRGTVVGVISSSDLVRAVAESWEDHHPAPTGLELSVELS